MKLINGKYNTAKIFTENVEETAIEQIRELCNQEFVYGSSIRIMPDVHAGAGCVIGTTMTITDKIVPNLVGVDIGCGMYTAVIKNLKRKDIDFEKLDRVINEHIPSGFSLRNGIHPFASKTRIDELRCKNRFDMGKARRSIGTLGGGNHFIEMNEDNEGKIYIVIHSGSRNLGLQVCNYYQEKAFEKLSEKSNRLKEIDITKLIDNLKAQGKYDLINSTLEKIKKEIAVNGINKNLSYVEGEMFHDYIHDMKIMQEYAVINRQAMLDEIITRMDYEIEEEFSTIHNYIDTENMVLRKGAVSAKKGEKLLIPINMRDGSLICVGKGNEDWNNSAPHGAGRLMGRNAAKLRFTIEEFKKSMEGIYSSSINKDTIDEAPMAYKPIKEIIENIKETAEIIAQIRPIYNFKATEESISDRIKRKKEEKQKYKK
ncbi:RtcB family protein [Fusobacterium sp. PH5-44]|uniref:RtcB family protein n=1 Tax=unclassified Fusobacterium TaxID=2648384 RepID=UPI003D1D9804